MKNIWLFFLMISISAYGQNNNKPMVIAKNAIQKLNAFKKEVKFNEETSKPPHNGIPYTGLSNPKLKPTLTVLINKAADDFILTAKNNPTEKKFQDDIKNGLSTFNPLYLELDTEDREKICGYFEELMDCVGLESSGGHLNDWMYGFDPTKKN